MPATRFFKRPDTYYTRGCAAARAEKIAPDLHVGAGGAVAMAKGVFQDFDATGKMSAINLETNARYHDHERALNEAKDRSLNF